MTLQPRGPMPYGHCGQHGLRERHESHQHAQPRTSQQPPSQAPKPPSGHLVNGDNSACPKGWMQDEHSTVSPRSLRHSLYNTRGKSVQASKRKSSNLFFPKTTVQLGMYVTPVYLYVV